MFWYRPVFNSFQADILVFGFNSSLKKVKSELGMSSNEFLILLAGYSIQIRYLYGFKPTGIRRLIPTLWWKNLYLSLDRIESMGLITRIGYPNKRAYKVTQEGIDKINTFKSLLQKNGRQIKRSFPII